MISIPSLSIGGGVERAMKSATASLKGLPLVIVFFAIACAVPDMCEWLPEDCRNSSLYDHKDYEIHCYKGAFLRERYSCKLHCGKAPYVRPCFMPPNRGNCPEWVKMCGYRTTPAPPTENVPILSTPEVQTTTREEMTASKPTAGPIPDQSLGEMNKTANNETKDVLPSDLAQDVAGKNQTEEPAKDTAVTPGIRPHSHKEQDIEVPIMAVIIILLVLSILFVICCGKCKGCDLWARWWRARKDQRDQNHRNDDVEMEPLERDRLLREVQGGPLRDAQGGQPVGGAAGEGYASTGHPPPNPLPQLLVTSERGAELEDKLKPYLRDDSDSSEVVRMCEEHLLGKAKKEIRRMLSNTSDCEKQNDKKENTRFVRGTSISNDDVMRLALEETTLTGQMMTALTKATVNRVKPADLKVKVVAADEKLRQLAEDLLDKQDVVLILRSHMVNGEDREFSQHYLLIVEVKTKLIHVCDSSTRTMDESVLEAERRVLVGSIPEFEEFHVTASRITVDNHSDVVSSGLYVIRFVEAYLTALNEDKYQIDGEAGYYLQFTMTPEAYRMQLLEQLGTQNC